MSYCFSESVLPRNHIEILTGLNTPQKPFDLQKDMAITGLLHQLGSLWEEVSGSVGSAEGPSDGVTQGMSTLEFTAITAMTVATWTTWPGYWGVTLGELGADGTALACTGLRVERI